MAIWRETSSREGPLGEDISLLIRFRNYAEELRAIEADQTNPQNRNALLRIAADYDRMAASVEAIIKSRNVVVRLRQNSNYDTGVVS